MKHESITDVIGVASHALFVALHFWDSAWTSARSVRISACISCMAMAIWASPLAIFHWTGLVSRGVWSLASTKQAIAVLVPCVVITFCMCKKRSPLPMSGEMAVCL